MDSVIEAVASLNAITLGDMTLSQRQLVELANLAAKAFLLFVWPSNSSCYLYKQRCNINLTSLLIKPNVTVTQHPLEGWTGVL